jgi:hypothetical protein
MFVGLMQGFTTSLQNKICELLTVSARDRFVGKAERFSSSTIYLLGVLSKFPPLAFDNGTKARAEFAFSKARSRAPTKDFAVNITPKVEANESRLLGWA